MPLVAAQIAPHGWDIVDGFTEDAGGALTTRASMKQVGKLFHDAGVEVIVLVGPHGTRVEGAMALTNVARGAGTMIRQGQTWETNVPIDRQFVLEIDRRAKAAGVNTALVGYAGNRPDQSAIVMDWGAIVPLTFNGHPENRVGFGTVLGGIPEDDHGPQVVLITPSRAMGRQAMVDFGKVLGEAFRDDPRKIGFIASCDWGHAHTADGPYGFHPDAATVDAKVVDAIEKNDLLSLLALTDEEVQNAAIDGLWQTLILAGIDQVTPLDSTLFSYEHPTYFGMVVAGFTPAAAAVAQA